jgi:hypothetical protein
VTSKGSNATRSPRLRRRLARRRITLTIRVRGRGRAGQLLLLGRRRLRHLEATSFGVGQVDRQVVQATHQVRTRADDGRSNSVEGYLSDSFADCGPSEHTSGSTPTTEANRCQRSRRSASPVGTVTTWRCSGGTSRPKIRRIRPMSCARLKRRTVGCGDNRPSRGTMAPARRRLVYARRLIVEPLCTSVSHRDGMIAVTSRTVSTTCTSAASSDLSTPFAAALPAKAEELDRRERCGPVVVQYLADQRRPRMKTRGGPRQRFCWPGADSARWAGAGSNRRPITFQAIARTN